MHNRNGYTLIELLIVVSIAGILAAMAAPRYGDALSRYRIEIAAKRVAADLTLAQNKARTLSTSRSVVYTVSTSTYQIPGEADLNLSTNTYTCDLRLAPYHSTIYSASFGGNGSVTFNGYGVPSAAGSVQVRCGSLTRTISIDADTGSTTIQ